MCVAVAAATTTLSACCGDMARAPVISAAPPPLLLLGLVLCCESVINGVTCDALRQAIAAALALSLRLSGVACCDGADVGAVARGALDISGAASGIDAACAPTSAVAASRHAFCNCGGRIGSAAWLALAPSRRATYRCIVSGDGYVPPPSPAAHRRAAARGPVNVALGAAVEQ